MRIRRRKSRSRRRLDELALNVRTATWLGRLLWRPTLLQVVTRPRRHRLFARH